MDLRMKRKGSPHAVAPRGQNRGTVRRASGSEARSASGTREPVAVSFAQQMRDFLHRNSSGFLMAGLVLLILQDVFGTHGVLAMRRSAQQAAEIQQEIQQLNDENQKLENRVRSLKTDPSSIERIAREEMGLARPGEYIFKIQPKAGEPSTPLAQPAEAPKKP
jgi:cell division protein FtsB